MNEAVRDPEPDCKILPREMTWPLRHLSLAGLHWPTGASRPRPPLILIHGWLDNALSFSRLAPLLAMDRNIYAIDLAGHGRSGHRPPGQGYPLTDYVADLAELIDTHFSGENGEHTVDLVGHSLGGIVGLFYAAAFPERVQKMAMIDSLGPLTRPPSEVVSQLRKAIRKRLTGSGKPMTYASVEEAAKARESGMIPLSHRAAMTLIPRNLTPTDGGYVWSTDAQLRHPSMVMMDELQVIGCLEQVKTPTCFIRAEQGIFVNRPELNPRMKAIPALETVSVPGGHHCHLEGDVAYVAKVIKDFMNVC